jgi:hypothetical protein
MKAQEMTARFEKVVDALHELFSRPAAALLVASLILVWRLILSAPADPDLFARVGMGRLVAQLGYVPLQDPFAFTAKLPMWIDHEWLSGVVFYQIARQWGDAGLITLKLIMSAWTAALLVRASMHYSPNVSGRVFWASVCILEASYLWVSTVRCQVFTYFVIALIYYGFVQYRVYRVKRYLLLVPIALIALVNMHGGYALSVVVLWILTMCSVIERKPWRTLMAVSSISLLAPILTPYGFETFVRYLVHALSMPRPAIPEWAPIYRTPSLLVRVIIVMAPVAVGALILGRRRIWDITALSIVAFALYCGISHERFVGFAAITALVFGVRFFSQTVEYLRDVSARRMLVVERAGSLVGAVVVSVALVQSVVAVFLPQTWRLDTKVYPEAALEWLRNSGARGRLLVDFNNGSYAGWRLYPQFLVSLDGRYEEVYSDEAVRDVPLAFAAHTPDGRAALERIAPTHILFINSNEATDAKAALSPKWRQVYQDSRYTIVTLLENHPEPVNSEEKPYELWSSMF